MSEKIVQLNEEVSQGVNHGILPPFPRLDDAATPAPQLNTVAAEIFDRHTCRAIHLSAGPLSLVPRAARSGMQRAGGQKASTLSSPQHLTRCITLPSTNRPSSPACREHHKREKSKK